MEKEKSAALRVLQKILETQPNLLTSKLGSKSGADTAEFCIGFIERYSEWLKQNGRSAD